MQERNLKFCIRFEAVSDKKIFLFHEPHYSMESILVTACVNLGFKEENIILSGHQMSNQEVLECDIYYCGEGNTFEELSILRERGLDSIIKEGFNIGNKIYIGCSAGAAIAGVSVEEIKDFDKNDVGMTDFSGLGLFDGIIHNQNFYINVFMEIDLSMNKICGSI